MLKQATFSFLSFESKRNRHDANNFWRGWSSGAVVCLYLGDSLVGQAAAERHFMEISSMRANYLVLQPSLIALTPRQILALPLLQKCAGSIAIGLSEVLSKGGLLKGADMFERMNRAIFLHPGIKR